MSGIVVETFETAVAPPAAPPPPRRRRSPGPKLAAAGIALILHALAIAAIANLQTASGTSILAPSALEATLLAEAPVAYAPVPDVALIPVEVDLPPLEPVAIDEGFGMGGSLQPPRMDVAASPDIIEFSSRMATSSGQMATIHLLLDVDAKGRVSRALVVRSTGNAAADAAAEAYARATRWFPGRISGTAQPMQTSLTVIFGGTPSVSAAN